MCEDRSGNECLLEGVESITTRGIELPGNIFLDKVC